jgi:hypothetical protein
MKLMKFYQTKIKEKNMICKYKSLLSRNKEINKKHQTLKKIFSNNKITINKNTNNNIRDHLLGIQSMLIISRKNLKNYLEKNKLEDLLMLNTEVGKQEINGRSSIILLKKMILFLRIKEESSMNIINSINSRNNKSLIDLKK